MCIILQPEVMITYHHVAAMSPSMWRGLTESDTSKNNLQLVSCDTMQTMFLDFSIFYKIHQSTKMTCRTLSHQKMQQMPPAFCGSNYYTGRVVSGSDPVYRWWSVRDLSLPAWISHNDSICTLVPPYIEPHVLSDDTSTYRLVVSAALQCQNRGICILAK